MDTNKSHIAQKLGIKPNVFSEILKNRMNVGTDLISLFCEEYNISADWLLSGKGQILKKSEEKSTNVSIIDNNSQQISYDINKNNIEIKELIDRITELKQQLDSKDKIITCLMRQQEILINKLTEKL
jgi:transcriptional regulator with XRE-family HTH domain